MTAHRWDKCMFLEKLTHKERLAIGSLASIMALRLIGLFMIVPIFALYAKDLAGSTPVLVGIAIGIYGLTQGLFQIPFGMLSDRIGRKPVIFLGLGIFALGSLIAALSDQMMGVVMGRALQGAGAIGSTVLACLSDLTREQQRTKAMAIQGMVIGLSFMLAMLIGPLLSAWMHLQGIFGVATLFSFIAMIILYKLTPDAPLPQKSHEASQISFMTIVKHPQLWRLNLSVCLLHALFTASFVVLPVALFHQTGLSSATQWKLYLPSLTIAFTLTFFFIFIAENRQKVKPLFLTAIGLLGLSEIGFFFLGWGYGMAVICLTLFFAAFSTLEAFLPSWVSKTAPAHRKGAAIGIYSTSQFMGVFFGGWLGGVISAHLGIQGVYFFCAALTLLWLPVTFGLKSQSASQKSPHQ